MHAGHGLLHLNDALSHAVLIKIVLRNPASSGSCVALPHMHDARELVDMRIRIRTCTRHLPKQTCSTLNPCPPTVAALPQPCLQHLRIHHGSHELRTASACTLLARTHRLKPELPPSIQTNSAATPQRNSSSGSGHRILGLELFDPESRQAQTLWEALWAAPRAKRVRLKTGRCSCLAACYTTQWKRRAL